jgi:hypothetical protein
MSEPIVHLAFGILQVIFESTAIAISQTPGEIFNGALEGMFNRINGRFR